MSANINAVPGSKFTDEMLAKNFMAIADGLMQIEDWSYHIESRLGEITRLAEAAKKVKAPSRVKPFLFGAVVGVAAYRYVRNNPRKIEQIKRQAQEQVDQIREQAQEQMDDFKKQNGAGSTTA